MSSTVADHADRLAFCRRGMRDLFEVVRTLSRRQSFESAEKLFPEQYKRLLRELLHAPWTMRGPGIFRRDRRRAGRREQAGRIIRLTALIRNLAVQELVLAGDCWDRGPRGDRVVDLLMKLPKATFIWGNHDTVWLSACLGHEPSIAHILRFSARYRRFSQLEEGYGVTLQPLEHLVRAVYHDDPATCFKIKGTGLRDDLTMMRMQKAAAVMQFKLEGRMIARNPQWELESRRLLHRLDLERGTVEIDGKTYLLKDTFLPTIDPADPYGLSEEEQTCMDRLRLSFKASKTLGANAVSRRPRIDVQSRQASHFSRLRSGSTIAASSCPWKSTAKPAGSRLVRCLRCRDRRLARAEREGSRPLWYLWCGPRSPLFGKDKITTFEIDLIDDPETHVETKNPYFRLIHEVDFCERVLGEFGVDPENGLIVNGHVPVKIEKGESPMKRSGKAITIDGAFSSAYGDHGYTLMLEPDRTLLAKHHHFESVRAAVRDGVDIIPEIAEIRRWNPPCTILDGGRRRGFKERSSCWNVRDRLSSQRFARIMT